MINNIFDIQRQFQNMVKNFYVVCDVCYENFEYKPYFAKEHLSKYPDHQKYKILKKANP